MANEITLQFNIKVSKNGAVSQINPSVRQIDQAGKTQYKNIQVIGTSAEEILLGDVSAARFLVLRSIRSDNPNISIYQDSGGTNLVGILAGEDVMVVPTASVLYAKAASATADLEILAFIA